MSQVLGAAVDTRFARILSDRDLRTWFQPIVRLSSGAVIGYEALVRGPEGSGLTSAASLLAGGHRTGRVVEFDWAARASACRAALEADLDVDTLLFMNIEPIAIDSECPADLWPVIEQGFRRFRVVLEVTERSLDRDPGTLLDGIERQRRLVSGIAVDDCGSHPATLAMLPLIAPSVIKIDSGVVQSRPGAGVARVLDAVHEQAERTGAIVVAEGVETAAHRDQAAAIGAHYGQGYLFGRPRALSRGEPPRGDVALLERGMPAVVRSPFEALGGRTIAKAGDDLIAALMRDVGACADVGAPVLHVALLPRPELLDPGELQRLARLARGGTFAAVLGPGVPSEPGGGIRGIGSRRASPPVDEWAAITVGACSSVAVLARRTPGGRNEWQYGITHDRSRAIAAARSLIRLVGAPEPRFHFDL